MSAVIINVDTSLTNIPTIEIGKQGENGATQVAFDVSEMIETYGAGTAYVVVQRRGDAEPYLLDNTVQSGNTVTWTVSNIDTDVYGTGRVQLFWLINEQVAKTVTYQFYVEEALHDPQDAPVVPGGWISEEIAEIREDLSDLEDRVEALEEGGGGSGLTDDAKTALLACFRHIAFLDSDDDYYQDLYDALYAVQSVSVSPSTLSFSVIDSTQQLTAATVPSGADVTWTSSDATKATVSSSGLVTAKGYGSCTITATAGGKTATCSVVVAQATLTSISAVYTQSGTVYNTDSLDSLKSDLVVTATWSDSSTSTVASTDYTLSGTLTVGTSVITVTYGGKTTTFNVTVTEYVATPIYNWDFTTSMTDTVESLTATTTATQSENGLYFNPQNKYAEFPGIFQRNRTYEIDLGNYDRASVNQYARLFMVDSDTATDSGGSGFIFTGTKKNGDVFYINGSWESTPILDATTDPDGEYFENSTVGFYVDSNGYCSVYKDGVLLGTSSTAFPDTLTGENVYFGSSNADYLYKLYITGFRVYTGNKY